MLRIQKLALNASVLLLVWLYALTLETSSTIHTLIALAPVLSVILFGAYLALSLVIGVAVFKTVPAEAELLQKDVERARKALAQRGITTS